MSTPPPPPPPPPIPQIPVGLRFPNRYSGGYNSSTVIEKTRRQTVVSVQPPVDKNKPSLNGNSNGSADVLARKGAGCCR